MEMKSGLLEAEEGKGDITNKLCELREHKCLCAAPAGMLEQSLKGWSRLTQLAAVV